MAEYSEIVYARREQRKAVTEAELVHAVQNGSCIKYLTAKESSKED